MAVNEAQKDFWSGGGGKVWVEQQVQLDQMIGPMGDLALAKLPLSGGENVLDIGCGAGTTSLELVARVGASGHVHGADISEPLTAYAKERAAAAGLDNLTFSLTDMQVDQPPHAPFDAVFSRFGVMFFEDAYAGFNNIHAAMKPGAPLAFVCWQAQTENPWTLVAAQAIMPYVELPAPLPPKAPGPFAFQEQAYVADILAQSGFKDVEIEGETRLMTMFDGVPLEEAVARYFNINPTIKALINAAEGVDEAEIVAAVTEAFKPYHQDGKLQFQGAVWVVTARA
ncbi:MAG: class I SAM-dependent methyltransferase [Alphaproteobacteria bacterium]